MITEYNNGAELVERYAEFLDTNKYLTAFFHIDGKLVTEITEKNYAYSAENGGKRLLTMRADPFSVLLFGDGELIPELFNFMYERGCVIDHILCDDAVGAALTDYMKHRRGLELIKALGMDFMECREKTAPTDPYVETATEADLEEIAYCMQHFLVDCGLTESLDKEQIRRNIGKYRIIRADGRIVATAALTAETETSMKIVSVYTRDEYRGKGYARKAVNAVKNEILDKGYIATLNVDQKNPISYHLYLSLGFKKLFSQGEYRFK